MLWLRASATAVALVAVCFAHSEPQFLDVVKAKYGLGTCQTCHTTPPQRNDFGLEVERALKKAQKRDVDAELLASLESGDADRDGVSNGDELRQGSAPGEAVTATAQTKAGLIPSHAFHPLAVHFPIALFLFGAFLDAFGARRKDEPVRRLATWNLAFGAVSGVLAVATGLTSFFMKGLSWEGLTLWHPVLAIAASLAMLGAAAIKVRQPAPGRSYWVVLLLAVGLLTVAGHLGASIIYG